jgi:ABC-type dipeptide/oligopeptide/nickel transport system permease component
MSRYWGIAIITQIILAVILGTVLPVVSGALLTMMSAGMSSPEKAEEYRRRLKQNLKQWIIRTIGFLVAAFLLADGIILAMPYVWAGYLRLLNRLNVQAFQTFIAAAVIGVGYGAFKFKEAKKKWYGVVEVAFSFVSVVVAFMTTKPENRVGLVITIIGAMYISSRGFGNWLGKEETNSTAASINPQASLLPPPPK